MELSNFIAELWNLLGQLVVALWGVVSFLGGRVLHWALPIAWFAWWLWGVNWNKAWPALRSGAWVVVVLAVFTGAMVWAQLAPSSRNVGIFIVPNFWWQLGAVTLLAGLTLFCGWLQSVMNWSPAEIELEPHEEPHGGHAVDHGHH